MLQLMTFDNCSTLLMTRHDANFHQFSTLLMTSNDTRFHCFSLFSHLLMIKYDAKVDHFSNLLINNNNDNIQSKLVNSNMHKRFIDVAWFGWSGVGFLHSLSRHSCMRPLLPRGACSFRRHRRP